MSDGGRAELIADRGAVAETADFFRSRPFLDAEGVTHTLSVTARGWTVALPVVLREVPGDGGQDAISPYGYPAARVEPGEGSVPDPAEIDWSPSGLVSLFARDRPGDEPCLAGARHRSEVQVHDPARPRQVRSRFAEQIRRNLRLGYAIEAIPGPDAPDDARRAFHSIYTETMERAGAAERYFFTPAYLDAVMSFDRSWLVVARAPGGDLAAAALAATSDGLLHYYLGGTASQRLPDSPFKNVVAVMLDLADELGLPLNLGGGVVSGDGLEEFKQGFANSTLPFWTHEVVCDTEAYARLAAGRSERDFFPLYRAPTG